MKKVPEHVLVVFDEAYYELADSDEYPNGLDYLRDGRSNVIVMRTFSKAYGLAGIRLGYAVAVPEVIAALHTVKEPFAVSQLAPLEPVVTDDGERYLYFRGNDLSRDEVIKVRLSNLSSSGGFPLYVLWIIIAVVVAGMVVYVIRKTRKAGTDE